MKTMAGRYSYGRWRRLIHVSLVTLVFPLVHCMNPAFGAEYYLSSTGNDTTGNGSYANPWKSPAKARKSTGAIQPGDTVIFKNGTYNYGASDCLLGWTADDGGASGSPITYKAETRGSVTIDFGGGFGWRLDSNKGAAYIVLDGFNLVNIGQTGLRFGDIGQVARYVNVTATPTWPPSGSPGDNAVSGGGFVTTATAQSFLLENCIADNCAKLNDSHGVYMAGGSGTIRDSIFRNNVGNGVQIQAGNSTHNIQNLYVYRNQVYNNSERHGIYVKAYGVAPNNGSIDYVWIYNNLVWNNGKSYASGYGITVNQADNGLIVNGVFVENNTVYDNNNGAQHIGSKGSFRNNIVVASALSVDINANTVANGNITLSNNLETGGFAASNFQSTDPASAYFLKLKPTASAAINKGANTGITDDYFGNVRENPNALDVGAHEFRTTITTPASDGYSVGAGVRAAYNAAGVAPADNSIIIYNSGVSVASGVNSDAADGTWNISVDLTGLGGPSLSAEAKDTSGKTSTSALRIGSYAGSPAAAVLSTPVDGAQDQSLTPTLTTNAFVAGSDPAHAETRWEIASESGASVYVKSSSANLTTFVVPDAILNSGSTYYWRAQFKDGAGELSPWPSFFYFTTKAVSGVSDGMPTGQIVAPGVDLDGDGNADSVDLNSDGIPDGYNSAGKMKSVITAVNSQQVGVSWSGVINVSTVSLLEAIDPSTIADNTNRPGNLPLGLIKFKLELAASGVTVYPRIYFSNAVASGAKWYKYDTATGWRDFSDYSQFSADGKSVVLTLVDGGVGDSDGVANGIIVDPGGVSGSLAVTGGGAGDGSASPQLASGSGGGGGCFISTILGR